jgi:lipopolysaccharide export system protein LptC
VARPNPAPDVVTQPIAARASSRTPMDWGARARTSAAESKRYTRFVTVVKRILLLAALALLGVVLIYTLQPSRKDRVTMTFQKLGIVNNDLAMVKPRLTGLDTSGNPYVVTAETAIQDAKNTRRAKLFNVDADLTQKIKGTWMSLTAPRGVLDADAHKLVLEGPIAAYSDDGNEVHTMAANIDLKNGIVRGSRMIVGQGPMGTMRADRFWLNRDKHLVFLNGNVRMVIVQSHAKKPQDPSKKKKKP